MNEIHSRRVTVGDLELHYLECGTGEPVLLLHGWPTNAQLWRHSLTEIGRTRRAIALDLPGFGESDKPHTIRYGFSYFTKVITGFLEAIEVDKTGLVVHDLGGPIGLHWGATNPDRVTELVLLNTLAFVETSLMVKVFVLSTFVPGLRSYVTSQKGLRFAMRFGVQNKARITDEVAEIYQAPYRTKTARKALLKTAQGLGPRGFKAIKQWLTNLDIPVGLLYGEADRILPNVAKTMKRVKDLQPDAELASIPDCGHFLQEDRPVEVAEYLANFFSKERP